MTTMTTTRPHSSLERIAARLRTDGRQYGTPVRIFWTLENTVTDVFTIVVTRDARVIVNGVVTDSPDFWVQEVESAIHTGTAVRLEGETLASLGYGFAQGLLENTARHAKPTFVTVGGVRLIASDAMVFGNAKPVRR